jgi:hypothetical protein
MNQHYSHDFANHQLKQRLLDLAHTSLTWAAIWEYCPISINLSGLVTCDHSNKNHILSEAKICVTKPQKQPFWADFGFFQCEGSSKIFGTCDKCDISFCQRAL